MDFKSALTKVCHDFSKDIIFQRRIISILDDYMAFKDAPYYKMFYKTILNIGDMAQLISQNPNERAQAIYTFLSISGLDEAKVKNFLSFISECYYDKQYTMSRSSSHLTSNKESQTHVKPKTEHDLEKKENLSLSHNKNKETNQSQFTFMGIPLGIDFIQFSNRLINKGFKRIKNPVGIVYVGKFLTFDACNVQVFKTIDSNIVYRIDVFPELNSSTSSVSQYEFNAIVELYVKQYGKYKNMQKLYGKTEIIFEINKNEIRLIKPNDSLRIEYIEKRIQQLNGHERKLKKQRMKNDENQAFRNMLQQNIDYI